jgi:hypothetical protein
MEIRGKNGNEFEIDDLTLIVICCVIAFCIVGHC